MSISVQNISKSYKELNAVDAVSFEVNSGELFGLIGPDGAGKTTIFRILTTLLIADEGQATVVDFDVIKDFKAIRNSVGYMPGKFSLYQDLTVEENLTFFATIFGTTIKENYDLIEDIYVQIEPFKNRRAGALSGGMKQKLALCCALIHAPKVLFLDEPTTGVDPVSRKEFWQMLKRLQQKGITILVSTPYMDEAALCDRIALIQKGKVLKIDSPQAITSKYEKVIYDIQSKNTHGLIHDLKNYPSHYSVYAFGEFIHYIDKNTDFNPKDIIAYLENKNHSDIIIKKAVTTIEDVFMDL
ncbi:MAG: ABC transporter ATP-binding protein [Flavobacterium sp.]|jgi:ABC-type multidrug transport system ATPase subunit|uniref:ABC transporter ATP-binding protein n=1 Tax=Flavobacterium sp. TaxID=239 RepID=UPI001B686858|nr:ABC transporter ATP-binding protein [Flavobacterium sp.]MBP6146636.1 ABC transporter ATP-binding protein [Flavobacterium sp.]MBP7182226.1 ABC transporter ATP-binding protein [Flavobacterium sp.]MBP7317679.1 ABC transporter ATP-binding protein [Flavobacterium sp.]MBP8886171.1 ABC transporter ATP-binding protein [Flavobacterium sp.]HRL70750.1 ABC transporter ATP-binding protein [Flavobacterium sp.]